MSLEANIFLIQGGQNGFSEDSTTFRRVFQGRNRSFIQKINARRRRGNSGIAINEAGCLMTGEMLSQFDTDGSPIMIGAVKWTTKGQISKTYQTPYGEAEIERHIYQSPKGGAGFCPLERDARIILTATPKFAKLLSSKYAEFGSSRVNDDLESNHGRKVARSFIQNVCGAVGAVALAKEGEWEYALPEIEKPLKAFQWDLMERVC